MTGLHDELTTLLAAGPPLHRDDWSLDDEGLRFVVESIAGGQETVIECGSGASTVMIARALRRRGSGTVSSLEHDCAHAARTRRLLANEDLDGCANVIDAPLAAEPLAEPGCQWYKRNALTALPARADLLLVDGPPASPGGRAERSRYPALPLLADRLAPGCVVVLDDAHRAGERWVAEAWGSRHGLELRTLRRLAVGVYRPGGDQAGA